MMSNNQESSSISSKRKALPPISKASSTKKIVKTSAKATVRTNDGGSATMKLTATVPRPSASSRVTVKINSGTASAQVSASAPIMKQKTSKTKTPGPMLMLHHGKQQTCDEPLCVGLTLLGISLFVRLNCVLVKCYLCVRLLVWVNSVQVWIV